MEPQLQHVARALVIALVAGFVASGSVAATTTVAGAGAATATPASASLSSAKVVIIVGATEGETSHYRDIADSAYAEAIQWSSNVVKVYSPNATWGAVSAAVVDASVVVYLGHGNGWPSPYIYDPNYTTKDGFGLNASPNGGDSNRAYYGEPYIRTLALAPNAVVLLNHLCYASGNSEDSSDPGLSVAMQRVDNYGAAFLRAGAGAVIAEGHGSINGMIRDLFSTHQTVLDMWRNQSNSNGNELSFGSSRTPGFTAFMDPGTTPGAYYRSLVGNPGLLTDTVIAPYGDTGVDRYGGADRFATAAAISAASFTPGVPVAYVATGMNFPDALAGAAAAGFQGVPVLLVMPDSIPAATAAELARLQPARIIILGSAGAVSNGVRSQLQAYVGG